jgi:8-oxo-dGTP pyrophosphatase MutT (NUDIX family)
MSDSAKRRAARLVILDAAGAVLLVRYAGYRTGGPSWFWATPGGGIEQGETSRMAAVRELAEETGLTVVVGPALWRSTIRLDLPQGCVDQDEKFFLVRTALTAPGVVNCSTEAIVEHRWWTIPDLETTNEVVYPEDLANRLCRIGLAG